MRMVQEISKAVLKYLDHAKFDPNVSIIVPISPIRGWYGLEGRLNAS